MNVIKLMLDDLESSVLQLGRVGENEHTDFQINCISIYADYPNASVSLTVQNPAGQVYPGTITRTGVMLSWVVKDSDLTKDGGGLVQFTFTNNSEVIKTVIGSTNILPSLGPTGEVPDPIEDWLQEAEQALNDLDAWNNVSASATTLSPGASATAEVTEAEGHKNFAFGLPSGASGEMVVETVTGSTPSITGVSNHRYICGTCSTLSITPPESGIIDVVFTSGTTATVLTVPNTVIFAAWFDKANLEANVTYEINIADGYGVVCKWA